MALVLAIDTTAKPVSCALADAERVIADFFAHTGMTHSQTLMPMVENLLRVADKSIHDLDAIAVNVGPGSFTGVRIGVSAVKGLAFTGEIPCIAVSTLESMAENVAVLPNHLICCLMDARCQQVYTALFEKDATGNLQRITADEALTIAQVEQRLREMGRPVVLVGDGSEMCYKVWKDSVPNVYLAPASTRYQNAASTAIIGARRFVAGDVISADELEVLYLRLPQAERELNARLNNK